MFLIPFAFIRASIKSKHKYGHVNTKHTHNKFVIIKIMAMQRCGPKFMQRGETQT